MSCAFAVLPVMPSQRAAVSAPWKTPSVSTSGTRVRSRFTSSRASYVNIVDSNSGGSSRDDSNRDDSNSGDSNTDGNSDGSKGDSNYDDNSGGNKDDNSDDSRVGSSGDGNSKLAERRP